MGQTKMKRKQFYDDGWTPITGTFTYASANTINVSSGAAAIYSVGDKIRYQNNDSGNYLYDYVITIADTLLTVVGDEVPNATLTDAYYSKVATSLNFPHFFALPTPTWTTTVNAFTNQPTNNYFGFIITGRNVCVYGTATCHATSGGTGLFIITFPAGSLPASRANVNNIGASNNTSTSVGGWARVAATAFDVVVANYNNGTLATNSQGMSLTVNYSF